MLKIRQLVIFKFLLIYKKHNNNTFVMVMYRFVIWFNNTKKAGMQSEIYMLEVNHYYLWKKMWKIYERVSESSNYSWKRKQFRAWNGQCNLLTSFEVKDVHMTDLISGRENVEEIQFIRAVCYVTKLEDIWWWCHTSSVRLSNGTGHIIRKTETTKFPIGSKPF